MKSIFRTFSSNILIDTTYYIEIRLCINFPNLYLAIERCISNVIKFAKSKRSVWLWLLGYMFKKKKDLAGKACELLCQ